MRGNWEKPRAEELKVQMTTKGYPSDGFPGKGHTNDSFPGQGIGVPWANGDEENFS